MIHRMFIPAHDYDLDATFSCGQIFRWKLDTDGSWRGFVAGHAVRLKAQPGGMIAETTLLGARGSELVNFLQSGLDLASVVASFPDDPPMRTAVEACRGLRLLRQDPWECLASFILSSTKQIVQIRQMCDLLAERFGDTALPLDGGAPGKLFPTADRIARCSEAELRACKLGFRAPNLLVAARSVASGRLNLEVLATLSCAEARAALDALPGVGRKIADCVLLFAYGFQEAFPVDVWVRRALQELYFPKRRVNAERLERFSTTHFGANAGYAQQYLFHYMRTRHPRVVRRKPRRSAVGTGKSRRAN